MRKSPFLLCSLMSIVVMAQVSSPAGAHGPAQSTAAMPVSFATALPRLQQTIETTRVDLARLRVDKWKTDSSVKQQAAGNIESLQRNMTDALPALVTAAQQNPSSLNASFKLYRNLNALYDVMTNVTETAGAFGSKDEYSALARDLGSLDNSRRAMADAMDSMTAQRDADYARIQQAARQAASQAASAPPKRIVIDDNESEKKPATKKSTTKKKPAASTPKQ